MTIPVAPVNISPQQAQQPQMPAWIGLMVKAMDNRAQLAIQLKKLQQDQEEFEVRKKLIGAQTQGAELINEQRKRELKAAEQDLADKSEALRLWTGSIPHMGDPKALGEVIVGIKNPGVAQHFVQFAQEGLQTQQQGATLQQTQQNVQKTGLDMAEDREIRNVLSQFADSRWDRGTIRRAIGQVVAINPQKAGTVATALNALLPDYQIHVDQEGNVAYLPKTPDSPMLGTIQPNRPTDEMKKLGTYALRVMENNAVLTDLERRFPGIGQRVDQRISAVRSVEQVPGLGKAAATQLLRSTVRGMTKEEQLYWNKRTDIGNALLRRASGAQINLEEIDRETTPYVAIAGEDESVVSNKQKVRLQLGLQFIEQSGPGFNPNLLSPSARRQLIDIVIPHPGFSPENPFAPKKP